VLHWLVDLDSIIEVVLEQRAVFLKMSYVF